MYAVLLPSFHTGPFVAWGELIAPEIAAKTLRLRIERSWNIHHLVKPEVAAYLKMRVGLKAEEETVYPEAFGQCPTVVSFWSENYDGSPRLIFTDREEAEKAFMACNVAWQLWLSNLSERAGVEKEVLEAWPEEKEA